MDPRRIFRLLSALTMAFLPVAFCIGQIEEPVLKVRLVIPGQREITVEDGDTVEIDGHQIIVQTEPVKTFRKDGLQFDYPRDYAYKFEEKPSVRTWTFDGNNFVILLLQFARPVRTSEFTREIVRRFGKKNCSLEDSKLTLNGNELSGKRIRVSLLGAALTFDLYPFKTADGTNHIIAFQDTKSDSGDDSTEGKETLALLSRTIVLNNNPKPENQNAK